MDTLSSRAKARDLRFEPYHAPVVFALGLFLRLWLIHTYPPVFGDDSVTRLFLHDRISIAHSLPALQASIFLLTKISDDIFAARAWMALIGAVAGVGCYYLAADLMGRSGGLVAALLFAVNPFLVAYSTVPYQEILMLTGLFFAFHFYFVERWVASSLSLGLACLARYEAWPACAVLAASYVLKHGISPMAGLRAAILFGWAPLAWVGWHGGLSPAGTYVLEVSPSPARLWRYVYLGWITAKFTHIPALLLAGAGGWLVFRQGLLLQSRFRVVAVFLALFLLSIVFSAHGDPRDQVRFVTAREAHLPISAVAVLAGLGWPRWQRLRWVLVAAGVLLGLWGSDRFLARETSQPRLQLATRVAGYLDRAVSSEQTALLLARPIPAEGVRAFLDRASRTGGEPNRRKAAEVLEQTGGTAPEFQRTAVHCRRARQRLRTLTSPAVSPARRREQIAAGLPDWIVLWSDFAPEDSEDARLREIAVANGPPAATFRADSMVVEIYRIRR